MKTIETQYDTWIKNNIKDSYGRCSEITEQMVKVFPELVRVRGHYYCPYWGERQHWWLVTQNGEIIDPTATQFPSKGMGHYEQWDESKPEPTGICPNCGEFAYDGNTCCSDACGQAYVAYCTNPFN